MKPIRTRRIAVAAAAATLLVAAAAPAAEAPTVGADIDISVSPKRIGRVVNGVGTPVSLKDRLRLHPSGRQPAEAAESPGSAAGRRRRAERAAVPVLQGRHAQQSARRAAASVREARRSAAASPRGTAVDLGVSSSGRLTFFNGPGGKSLTLNVSILNPALINTTFTAPIKKISGRFGYSVTFNVPDKLQNILDGPILVTSIDTTVGATRVVRGVRRGYIEAISAREAEARRRADSFFVLGRVDARSRDTRITCS